MMTKIIATGAAVAALLVAGGALAANDSNNGIPASSADLPQTVNPMPTPDWTSTPTQNSTLRQDLNPGSTAQAQVPVSTDVAATLGVPVETITNGPVPDTPKNRAKYGGPMSHAGRMTKPAGN